MIDNLSIVVLTYWRILASLSVDEILLLVYVNLSTDSRGLTLRVKVAFSRLKCMYSVLFALTLGPLLLTVCS